MAKAVKKKHDQERGDEGDPCYAGSLKLLEDAVEKAQKSGFCPRGFHMAIVYMGTVTQRAISGQIDPEEITAMEVEMRARAVADLDKLLKKLEPGKHEYHPEVL